MFSPPQAPRRVLIPCTFSFNSFGYLGISEFTHSPGGRCLQLHPLQRVCKKPQYPGSVQQGPHCILFIILGLAPHGFSYRLTDSACCGYISWMKHSPEKTQGRAHLPVCIHAHHWQAEALAGCTGFCISFIAEFPAPCYPEWSFSSHVSNQGFLKLPVFFHVISAIQGEGQHIVSGQLTAL